MRETNATTTTPHPIDTPSEYGPDRAIADLIPSPTNPRKDVAKAKIAELIDSLRANGMLQPILARPWPPAWKKPLRQAAGTLEIVDGERRYLAAGPAGLERAPVIVRALTDVDVLRVQLISNREREEIHPLDEAAHYARYLKAAGVDADALAAELGMSRSHVYQRLQLQKLIEPAQTALRLGELTVAHGVEIARLTPLDQARAVKATIRETEVRAEPDRRGGEREDRRVKAAVSVRELKAWVATNIHLDLARAPFPIEDVDLVASKAGLCQGACVACPYNSKVTPELFPEIQQRHGVCTNPAGYEYKMQGWLDRLKAAAAAEHGGSVLEVSTEEGYGGSRTRLPMLRRGWQPAGALECEASRWAIVAHLNPYGRSELKLGHVFRVCTAKGPTEYASLACPVHNKRERAASSKASPERRRRAKEQRERRDLKGQRAAIFTAIFATDGQPGPDDWRMMIEESLEHIYEPAAIQALGTITGWKRPDTYKPSRYMNAERTPELAPLRGRLKTATAAALQRLLFAVSLAGHVDEDGGPNDPLLAVAKRHKVDLEKIKADAKAKTKMPAAVKALKKAVGKLRRAVKGKVDGARKSKPAMPAIPRGSKVAKAIHALHPKPKRVAKKTKVHGKGKKARTA